MLAPEQPGRQSMVSQDQRIGGQLFESDSLKTKNLIFAIVFTIIQFFFCFIYGFLYYTPAEMFNVTSVVTAIFMAILIVAGFGLVFGYTKRLAWSGIGFNFFILVFCLQYYPLINAFWTKTQINKTTTFTDFSYDRRYYNFYLTNRDTLPTRDFTGYGNCITDAMKSALAMAVAFSCVLGRAGQIQCLIIMIIGVIGYELNRQLIQERVGADTFGTFTIFTFGGFMGLVLGLISYIREQRNPSTVISHISLKKYNAQQSTVIFSLLGVLIIFVFFPFLAYDVDANLFQNSFSPMESPLLLIYSMVAGCIGCCIGSILINGYLIPRDAIHGLIAGAVIFGSSVMYVANIVYALLTGLIGGLTQAIVQNTVERRSIAKGYVISTVSWSLFGIQGFLGGFFSAGWKTLANDHYASQIPQTVRKNFGEQNQIYIMLISVGLGMAFGLLAGLFIYLTNFQQGEEYFDDGYYWRNSDCIRPLVASPQPQKAEVQSESIAIEFQEGQQQEGHRKHAYL